MKKVTNPPVAPSAEQKPVTELDKRDLTAVTGADEAAVASPRRRRIGPTAF